MQLFDKEHQVFDEYIYLKAREIDDIEKNELLNP